MGSVLWGPRGFMKLHIKDFRFCKRKSSVVLGVLVVLTNLCHNDSLDDWTEGKMVHRVISEHMVSFMT